MSGEKKHWRLSTPLRRFSKAQDSPKAEVRHSGSRVSSVYLSDGSSTSGFTIVPEFDYTVQTHTTHERSSHNSHPWHNLPASPLSPNALEYYPTKLEPIGSHHSYLGGGACDTIFDTSRGDDLVRRLSFAYEHIRCMPSTASPKVLLSSDPQVVRKQLGVPQHSVYNYPIPSSLDLPNPHASPLEPASPGLPSATSVDTSHEKLGLSINMDTNTYSTSHHSHDPVHPTQSKSRPASTEGSPSQCSPLGTPWGGTRISCTSKPRPSNSKPSKLVKRRIEKTTSSPSSLSFSGREALRGVFRKPVADTSPSANFHRRQISLLQIRPPSPFRVDIPLHHAWHDRRTDFNAFTGHNSKIAQSHETNSRRTSGSTEVLASLAWIGTPFTANRICHPASPGFFPDRFSMGIAVEDDSISDDVLVDRLEKVRRISSPPDQPRDGSPLGPSSNTCFSSVGVDENTSIPTSCPPSSSPTTYQFTQSSDMNLLSPLPKNTGSESEDAAVWQAARKAFLCIREIVRTEKKYQEALKMLLSAQTATPPPPSMTPYVSALIRVSEMLLKRFLEDPSAWGVSTAFVTSEDELEATMVCWCAVAGTFFTDGNDPRPKNSMGRWRLRKSGVISSETKQTTTSSSPRLLPILSERIVEEYCTGQHLQTDAEKQRSAMSPEKSESKHSQPPTGPSRKLSVRDLAIQPIQRVMRYVLLYKDLLDCTPTTSPPRLLVQRALEAATRIANNCDGAQRNPAFCYAS